MPVISVLSPSSKVTVHHLLCKAETGPCKNDLLLPGMNLSFVSRKHWVGMKGDEFSFLVQEHRHFLSGSHSTDIFSRTRSFQRGKFLEHLHSLVQSVSPSSSSCRWQLSHPVSTVHCGRYYLGTTSFPVTKSLRWFPGTSSAQLLLDLRGHIFSKESKPPLCPTLSHSHSLSSKF